MLARPSALTLMPATCQFANNKSPKNTEAGRSGGGGECVCEQNKTSLNETPEMI